ncbi:MAG: hypothetical protein HC848_08160 [Limnobacter sp.]|nr:hypothetical protein [Limnobacter sp.]
MVAALVVGLEWNTQEPAALQAVLYSELPTPQKLAEQQKAGPCSKTQTTSKARA